MKLMIASDIHGSLYWGRRLLEAMDREGAPRLLLLGDLLYHGPRNALPEQYAPQELAALLNGRKGRIFGVRGNCDAEIDQVMLSFPMMAEYCLVPLGDRLLFAAHGHQAAFDGPPPLMPGDLFVRGHTHRPAWEISEQGILCLNPGSVSIPKDGTPHGYMIVDGSLILWKDTDGNEYHRLTLNGKEN